MEASGFDGALFDKSINKVAPKHGDTLQLELDD